MSVCNFVRDGPHARSRPAGRGGANARATRGVEAAEVEAVGRTRARQRAKTHARTRARAERARPGCRGPPASQRGGNKTNSKRAPGGACASWRVSGRRGGNVRAALGGGVVIRAVRRERHALGRRARPARPAPAPRRAAARRAAPRPGRQLQQSSAASCWRTRAPECAYSSATYGCWPSQPEGAQRGAQRRTPACQQLRSRPNAAHTRRRAARPAERSTRSLACLPPSLHEHSRWKGEHPARRARGRRGASHAGSANTLSCSA